MSSRVKKCDCWLFLSNNHDKRIKYNVNFTVQCPECQKDIKVGYAGLKELQQHQGSRWCHDTIAKEERLKKKQKKLTLFDVGVCRIRRYIT